MELGNLRYFLEIIGERSFPRGAECLRNALP
jgi:hypothetical protein